MNVKNLLAYLLTLVVSVSLTACPDDCGTEEGGAEGGAAGGAEDCGGAEGATTAGSVGGAIGGATGGAVAGTDTPATVYSLIVVFDDTTDVNNDGTPGVDICEVNIDCTDAEAQLDAANSGLGSEVCDGTNNDNCVCRDAVAGICGGTDRGDIELAYDGDASCSGDNYVSLGINGALMFDVGQDANGCNVSVFEKQGPNEESYRVFACPNDFQDVNDCIEVGVQTIASGESGVDNQDYTVEITN